MPRGITSHACSAEQSADKTIASSYQLDFLHKTIFSFMGMHVSPSVNDKARHWEKGTDFLRSYTLIIFPQAKKGWREKNAFFLRHLLIYKHTKILDVFTWL